MPIIDNYMDAFGRIDKNAWRYDIISRLLYDMEREREGFSTRELCRLYFGYTDYEKLELTGQQLQGVRVMLQDRSTPLMLYSHGYRWYVVPPSDSGNARAFINERSKRMVGAYARLSRYAEIGQETYALPADDRLIKAIEGSGPAMGELAEAIEPEPEETEPEP